MAKKAVVVFSGGLDSFTLLHDLAYGELGKVYGYTKADLLALTFIYGQKHIREIECARRVTDYISVEQRILNLAPILSSGESALTSDTVAVPHGHYADESMKQTFVPGRNIVFLSVATAVAAQIGARTVFYAAHAGDHAIYPDCRPSFIDAFDKVARLCGYEPISVQAPYALRTKGDIVVIGKNLGLDYGQSWTCYEGKDVPCGKCGACRERLEAFEFADISDPLIPAA